MMLHRRYQFGLPKVVRKDDRIIWDWLKYNIRAYVKQHSKRRARERNEKENRLEEEYAKAKQVFEADPKNTNSNIVNAAKENLEAFYDEKLNGVIIRTRTRWHEHGEKRRILLLRSKIASRKKFY